MRHAYQGSSFTEDEPKSPRRALISRNVVVKGRRTSVRLEPDMWRGLIEICQRERTSMHEICTMIAITKLANVSLTSATRTFIMNYFRSAATEEGHMKAQHGAGFIMGAAVIPSSPLSVSASISMSDKKVSNGNNGLRTVIKL